MDVSELRMILQEIGHHVRSIEIFRLNKRILDCLMEHCTVVTHVKLINPSNIFHLFSFSKYKSFLKHVISLEIWKGGFFYSKLRRVKRFQNFDRLLLALKKVETLESLKIEYIEISRQTFDHLKALKTLKYLHLNRYEAKGHLPPFIPYFPHLNEILFSTEDSETSELISEIKVSGKDGIDF